MAGFEVVDPIEGTETYWVVVLARRLGEGFEVVAPIEGTET